MYTGFNEKLLNKNRGEQKTAQNNCGDSKQQINAPKRLQPLINSYKNSAFSRKTGKLSTYQVKSKTNESIAQSHKEKEEFLLHVKKKLKINLQSLKQKV